MPAIDLPRGLLKTPMREKTAPNMITIQPNIGIQPVSRPIIDNTIPAVPILFEGFVLTITIDDILGG